MISSNTAMKDNTFLHIHLTTERRKDPVTTWRGLDRSFAERDLNTGNGEGATLTNNKIERGKETILVSFENAPLKPTRPPVPYLEHQITTDYYNYMRSLFKLHPYQKPTPVTTLFLIRPRETFALINCNRL